jgi:hypothetical protein
MKQDYIEVYLNKVELIEQYLDNSNIIVLLQQYIDDMKHGNVYDECDDDNDDDDDDASSGDNDEKSFQQIGKANSPTFDNETMVNEEEEVEEEEEEEEKSNIIYKEVVFEDPTFSPLTKEEGNCEIDDEEIVSINKNILTSSVQEEEEEEEEDEEDEEESSIIYKEVVFEDPTFTPLTDKNNDSENTPPVRLEPLD